MTQTLLNENQKNIFNEYLYETDEEGCFDGDIADYNLFTNLLQKSTAESFFDSIIGCSFLSPHEDQECGHEDIYTFQVLDLDPNDDIGFIYTRPCGTIVGVKVEIGKFYSFNYRLTHALLPLKLAHKVFEAQDFNIQAVQDFNKKRSQVGYKENVKMAFRFLNTEAANFSL